jgi:TonB-linked SusC/RagA family outer membrane protein
MKRKYFYIMILLSLAILLFPAKSIAQRTQQANNVTIESVVADESGNPIQGATIYGNEGMAVTKTDALGKFTISVPFQTDLLIEAPGHESKIFKSGEVANLKSFQLATSEFMYGQKDEINVAFGKEKRGDLVGAISVIEPDDIVEYDNYQWVASALEGRVPGMRGSSNIRGLGTPLFIVDGLPRDISMLSMNEVDQITVLKDINAGILYGSKAVNGVVLITTKRGEPYKKQLRVSGYYGIDLPIELPDFLPSYQYMELYNEAKVNDGLPAPYTLANIESFKTGNKYRYPDVDYYSSEYLKSFKPEFMATTELSGGNDVATYYANVGWVQVGSLLNFGEGKNGAENVFNVRGNVDLNINKYIKTAIDATALFDNISGQTGNFWSDAATLRPNLFPPLIPFNLIAKSGQSIVNARKTDVDGMYLLGGNSTYQTNAIAEGFAGGKLQTIGRVFSFNNRVDVDLNDLIQGLTFHTNVGFDLFTRYQQTVDNSYSVYTPVWDAVNDSITTLTKVGSDVRAGDQIVGNSYFERRFGFFGQFNYDRTFSDVHHIYATLMGYGHRYKIQGDEQGQKDFNFGLRLAYTYNKKYLVDFSASMVNSVKLPDNDRMSLAPSLGLAWIISKENFMSSLTFIDFLKLRATAGILRSDAGIDGFFYYDNVYTTSSSYNWYEGTYSRSGVISSRIANPDLAFESRNEINIGFDATLFKKMLEVEANLFASEYYDQITRPATLYPSFYSTYLPYRNYENNRYKGAELGLRFNKKLGDISLSVGLNGMYANSKVLIRDEVWENDYQYRKDKPIDAIFALEAEGLFADAGDIAGHALQAFGTVKPGDIKYVDQNGDGVVNSNDQIMIGRSAAPYSYGVDLKVSYKSFTLYTLGFGRSGADAFKNNNYYWVDGDDKYSDYILNRWTSTNKENATFPRLSSVSSSNNFQNSTYWLYENNYFDIQRVQLGYQLPESVAKILFMKQLNCYVDATNLLLISKFRKIRELNIGSEPQYRTISVGIRTLF